MPTVKNRELPDILAAMQDLARERLPIVGALRLRKMYRAAAAQWEDVVAVRDALLASYARCDDEGRALRTPQNEVLWKSPEDAIEAQRRFDELMDTPWDHPMTLDPRVHLGYDPQNAGGARLTAAMLIGLGPFLEDVGE